jgi:hypothetical protein
MKTIEAMINNVTDDPTLRLADLARAKKDMGQGFVAAVKPLLS